MTDAAIAQLENRLKTVTARLEQVEKQLASGGGSSGAGASSGGASASSGGGAAFVSAYDNLVSQYIDEYVKLSAQLGDADIQKQATAVKEAITAQRNFLDVASQSKKPSDSDLPNLLAATSKAMNDVATIRNQKGKQHAKFNYLSTLSEGINALGWVAITPAPAPFVDEARASSEFYSNKILMEYKNKEGGEVHKAWVHAVNEFLKELKNYVKQYHTTGVAWNPKGGNASSASVSSSSSSSGGGAPPPPVPSGGGPPAPPPGGGPPTGDDSSSGSSGGGGRAALLAEIDAVRERQKGGRTEGLKKVTADQKAKNRDPNDVVHVEFKERGTASKAAAKPAVTKPPRVELDGNKWVIEWQQGNKNIVISETETRQTVYIYKCENSIIQIKGKVNSIAVDGCKKTGIVFDSAIATAELVNCQSVQLQVTGRVPNIAVDKTDGCQLHLSKDCLDTEILTAKVSEMNINIPNPKDPNGDPIERPVPEQFKTVIKGSSLETVAVQHLA